MADALAHGFYICFFEIGVGWEIDEVGGRDVAHSQWQTVGHGFEQHEWKSLVHRRQHIEACVAIELAQIFARGKASEHHFAVCVELLEVLKIRGVVVACSCNHHLGHFGNVLSRLDEVLEALFGSQTAHAQDVGTRCDAMFLQEVGGGAAAGGRNAVGDISGFGKHAVGEFLTLKFVDKNNVVAESECQ